jgi:alkylated DNA repair protein alkB family protein 8
MKRRVQHYGYEFMYKTRNVDTKQYLGQLPVFLLQLLNRMALLPEVNQAENSLPFDQLTVRFGPCNCRFQQYCDSQCQVIDSLGQPELKTANNREQKQGIACLEE